MRYKEIKESARTEKPRAYKNNMMGGKTQRVYNVAYKNKLVAHIIHNVPENEWYWKMYEPNNRYGNQETYVNSKQEALKDIFARVGSEIKESDDLECTKGDPCGYCKKCKENGTLKVTESYGEKWGIMASVSGGVTGNRQSWAKSDGERMEFDTEEEAKAVALQYSERANSGHGAARFHYFAKPIMNLFAARGQLPKAQQRIRKKRLLASEGAMPEEDFIADVQEWGTAPEDQVTAGEGRDGYIEISGNYVNAVGSDRNFGALVSLGGKAVALRFEGELVGVIVREGTGTYHAFHYQTGYEGTNSTMESALDTLIIARWG